MPPSLSIVIPSHNRPDLLRACLGSVLDHAPADTEVIVVDDGSRDGAVEAVARSFHEIQPIRLPRCLGFCAAANAGIHAARGTVVELLNDDTEVTAGWATAPLTAFDDPALGAVAPLVLFPSNGNSKTSRIDSAGDRYYIGGIAGKRGHRQLLGPKYESPCRVFGASGSSAFYRREALLKVGAFPEEFGAYFDDVDLAFRLHQGGYHILYEPASRVYHHVSASHGRCRRRLMEQQSCNEERVFWRNLPGPLLVRALPQHLAVLVAKAWRRCQEGNLLPFLCGRLRLLGEVGEIARHRQRWCSSRSDLSSWLVETRYWEAVDLTQTGSLPSQGSLKR